MAGEMDPSSLRYGRFCWKSGSFGLRGRDRGAFGRFGLLPSGGQSARLGHGVVQFRDLRIQQCAAEVVDGEVHAYRWKRVSGWNLRPELFSL